MVNIVTIDGFKFLVDVGFSSFSPVRPIQLGETAVVQNGSQELLVSLKQEYIPDKPTALTQSSCCGHMARNRPRRSTDHGRLDTASAKSSSCQTILR